MVGERVGIIAHSLPVNTLPSLEQGKGGNTVIARIYNAKCGCVRIGEKVFWCKVPEKVSIDSEKSRCIEVKDESQESAQLALDKFLENTELEVSA